MRDDVAFWAERLERDRRDTTSAVKLTESPIELARATGDVTAYLRAEAAADAALAASPGYHPAAALRATVLVALHRFTDARDAAQALLPTTRTTPSPWASWAMRPSSSATCRRRTVPSTI